jgi:nucleotidyltransferase substrate binding protein (TIGR01987 family)
MEVLEIRYQAVQQALTTLDTSIILFEKSVDSDLHDALRDSIIKRFEYSIDTFWKYLKEYLEIIAKVTVPIISPKAVFRASLDSKLVSLHEFNILITMVDSRNLTSHAYNKILAIKIGQDIPDYYHILVIIIDRVKPQSNQ